MKGLTVIFLAVLIVGATAVSVVGLKAENAVALSKELLTTAAIVFGIIGAWVAVLNPTTVFDTTPGESSPKKAQLTQEFASLVVVATFVFAAAVILRVLVVVVPVEAMDGYLGRTIAFGVVYCLYGAEIYVLVGTLMPLARSARKQREDDFRVNNRS